MQRLLVLTPPYATAFMFAPAPIHGGPHGVWLRYDSSSDEDVLNFLRDAVERLEAEQEQYAQYAKAAGTLPAPEPVKVASPSQNVLSAIASMPTKSSHDWGAPYKIGLVCKKCNQKADGLEKACVIARWRPAPGDEVIDKRPGGLVYTVEALAENDRVLMVDGPVLRLDQIEPVADPEEDTKT